MFKKIFKISPDITIIDKPVSKLNIKQIHIEPIKEQNIDYTQKEDIVSLNEKYNELNHKYFELKRKNEELEENIKILSLKELYDNNLNQVEAEIWSIDILDGIINLETGSRINELYIPSWNIAFNTFSKELNIISEVDLDLRYSKSTNINKPQLIKKITLSKDLTFKLKNITNNFIENKKNIILINKEINDLLVKN